MENIFGYTIDDLTSYLESINEQPYKAKQIYDWLYKKRVYDFSLMTNLKKSMIERLNNDFDLSLLTLRKKEESKDVNKYLFELDDGHLIEAVLMKHDYGNSVCVSSQVGCNMACSFCESGRLRKKRDLKVSEMVRQILMIEDDFKERVSSVVVMGIGEPFDNYDNVMKFIEIINSPYGIEIGARHITVSTSGIVPKIMEYADNKLQTNLAISLHAPNDILRSNLMKVNKVYNIEKLMEALKYYIAKTNRRVTIEYLLLDNVNDTSECAIELSNLLKGMNVYVNLIPYNETSHIEYKRSSKNKVMSFYDILKKNNINVTIRREFGSDISAACGQLRASEVEE